MKTITISNNSCLAITTSCKACHHRLITALRRVVVVLAVVLPCQAVGQTLMQLAMESFDNMHYDMCLSYLKQELERHPDNGYALAYKGAAERKSGSPQQALQTMTLALDKLDKHADPAFAAWAHYERGALYAEAGDTTAAIADMDSALVLKPNDPIYHQDRAMLLYNQGYYREALAGATTAAQLAPDDVYNLEIIGRSNIHLKQYDDAIAAYERAATLDAVNADHWTGICDRLRDVKNTYNAARSSSVYQDTTLADEVVVPQFPGGTQALKDYIARNVRFPRQAQPATTNSVIVDCLINEYGQVSDCRVLQSAGEGFDDEALRLCRTLPDFAPATMHGVPTPCWYQVTVVFTVTAPICQPQPQ